MLPRDFPSKVFSRLKVPITETIMMHDEILLCGLFVVYVMTNQSKTGVECYFIPSYILFANKESIISEAYSSSNSNHKNTPVLRASNYLVKSVLLLILAVTSVNTRVCTRFVAVESS